MPPGLLFVHIPIHEHYTTQNQAPYADHVGGVADERPENYTSEKLAYPGLNDDKPVATQGQESDSGALHLLFVGSFVVKSARI